MSASAATVSLPPESYAVGGEIALGSHLMARSGMRWSLLGAKHPVAAAGLVAAGAAGAWAAFRHGAPPEPPRFDSHRASYLLGLTLAATSPWNVTFWLAAIVTTGTLGFSAVGTLFAAMLVRARTRDVLLPVLLYPITVPVIIAGVRATATLLQPDGDMALVRFWVALLVALDVVFVTLALWTFEPVMTD